MSYHLFLDDDRKPRDVYWVELPLVNWEIVRSYKEFVRIIEKRGLPATVSFDHDLGQDHYNEFHRANDYKTDIRYDLVKETGYHAAKWLLELCAERECARPDIFIHTQNHIGAENIRSLVNSFDKIFQKK